MSDEYSSFSSRVVNEKMYRCKTLGRFPPDGGFPEIRPISPPALST